MTTPRNQSRCSEPDHASLLQSSFLVGRVAELGSLGRFLCVAGDGEHSANTFFPPTRFLEMSFASRSAYEEAGKLIATSDKTLPLFPQTGSSLAKLRTVRR